LKIITNNLKIKCKFCKEEQDEQQHILQCKTLNSKLRSEELAPGLVKYEDIYGDHLKQKVIVTIFTKLLDIMKTMAEDSQQNTSDPSISAEMLEISYIYNHVLLTFLLGFK
jgi:hypothetical protein